VLTCLKALKIEYLCFRTGYSQVPKDIVLTRSTAPSPAFEGGDGKHRSELALSEVEGVNPCLPAGRLSKPRHLYRGVEGLTSLKRNFKRGHIEK
jgi:hypothetical protein